MRENHARDSKKTSGTDSSEGEFDYFEKDCIKIAQLVELKHQKFNIQYNFTSFELLLLLTY